MRVKVVLLTLLVSLVITFAILNWHLLATPVHVNLLLGFTDIPIGVLLSAVMMLLGLVFGIYLWLWQRRVMIDYRRQSQDLQAQRSLADDAESSRFTALSNLVKEELTELEQHLTLALETLRGEMHATENSISATLAEMDDRMRRGNEAGDGPR